MFLCLMRGDMQKAATDITTLFLLIAEKCADLSLLIIGLKGILQQDLVKLKKFLVKDMPKRAEKAVCRH